MVGEQRPRAPSCSSYCRCLLVLVLAGAQSKRASSTITVDNLRGLGTNTCDPSRRPLHYVVYATPCICVVASHFFRLFKICLLTYPVDSFGLRAAPSGVPATSSSLRYKGLLSRGTPWFHLVCELLRRRHPLQFLSTSKLSKLVLMNASAKLSKLWPMVVGSHGSKSWRGRGPKYDENTYLQLYLVSIVDA